MYMHTVFCFALSALSLFPFYLLDSILPENTGTNKAVTRSGIPYRRPHPIEKFDLSPNLDVISLSLSLLQDARSRCREARDFRVARLTRACRSTLLMCLRRRPPLLGCIFWLGRKFYYFIITITYYYFHWHCWAYRLLTIVTLQVWRLRYGNIDIAA